MKPISSSLMSRRSCRVGPCSRYLHISRIRAVRVSATLTQRSLASAQLSNSERAQRSQMLGLRKVVQAPLPARYDVHLWHKNGSPDPSGECPLLRDERTLV